MKHTILLILVFVALVVSAVGYTDSRYRTAIGRPAPLLTLSEADSVMRVDEQRGNYVLLSFWSGASAPSRNAVNEYTAWCRRHANSGLKLVNVNFDDSRALFEDLVTRDGLNADDNFYAAGSRAKAIIDTYGLKEGYGSLLIDPAGTIIAHNPTPQQLEKMVH